MKPRQPAYVRKVLIPEDETHLSPGESLGDFFRKGEIIKKCSSVLYFAWFVYL